MKTLAIVNQKGGVGKIAGDITTIPEAELREMLISCRRDMAICELAIAEGVLSRDCDYTRARLDVNEYIIKRSSRELRRREVEGE